MNERHFSTILLFLAAAGLGIFAFPTLAFDFKASHQRSLITISYSYPYAPPEEIERTITSKIEASIARIKGIYAIRSEISEGRGTTRAEVDKDTPLDMARFQVAQALRQIYRKLPEESGYPSLSINDPDRQEMDPTLLSYSLLGPEEAHRIFRYANEQLSPLLANIPGLQRIDTEGSEDEEFQIIFDEQIIQHLGITTDFLKDYIREQLERDGFPGIIYYEHYLQVKMEPKNIGDILKCSIPLPKGKSVKLSQLASVHKVPSRKNRYYRVNGQESVRLNFIPQQGVNQLSLAEDIRERIAKAITTLPPGYSLLLEFDKTEYIRSELRKIMSRTILSIGLLLLFVIGVYQNIRSTGILILAFLVNLGLATLVYSGLDIQLNLYALAGITVSFGIIIDNIIVMMHHFEKERNRKVFSALLTATLTTLSALLVLLVLPDSLREEMINFAKVLGINLGISLLVAYSFVPALVMQTTAIARHAPKRRKSPGATTISLNRGYRRSLSIIRLYRKTAIIAVILLFGLPVFWLPNQIKNWHFYNHTFGSHTYVNQIKPLANRLLGGSLRLFAQYVYESSDFRSTEESTLHIAATLPMGSTIEQMNELIVKIDSHLLQYSGGIKTFLSTVTSGQFGQIRILFSENVGESFPYNLKTRLESMAIYLGGATWNIQGVGRGFKNAHATSPPRFRVVMKGYNRDNLDRHASSMSDLLLKHPRITEVNTNADINWWEKERHEYVLDIDRKAMLENGINWAQLRELFSRHNRHSPTFGYTDDHKPIRLVSNRLSMNDLWALNNRLHTLDTLVVNFSSLASLQKSTVPKSIYKEDQQFLQTIEFEYTGNAQLGQQYLNECIKNTNSRLPLGYSVDQIHHDFGRKESRKQYALLALVVIVTFFICSIHYESFTAATHIIVLIPLSFIGIFLTFYWFDFPFDQGGYASFLLVSGISINSLILIFSDYYVLIRRFPCRKKFNLYLRAFRQKITPIYLTVISTTLGLIPFIIHGSQEVFWFSLAVGTIGGLIFSVVVVWISVPLFIK